MFSKKNKKETDITKGWAILMGYLAIFKRDLVILSILGVISAIIGGFIPYIIGLFMDSLITPSSVFIWSFEVSLWLFLITIFVVLQLTADVIDWRYLNRRDIFANIFFAEINSSYSKKLLYLPISFHKEKKSGEIFEMIHRSSEGANTIAIDILIPLSPQFLSIIIGIGIGFYINIVLATILLVGAIFFILSIVIFTKDIGLLVHKGHRAWQKAFQAAHEAVINIDLVKRFTTEKQETTKINYLYVEKAARSWARVELQWDKIKFAQRLIVTITRGTIFVVSAFLIKNNTITIGELIAFNGYAMIFFGPFMILGQRWQAVQNGFTAMVQIEETLSVPPEEYNKEISEVANGSVRFTDVCFSYPDNDKKMILDKVSFDINEGETVALVGESGVGKSTVIDLIYAFYFANKGKIEVGGYDIKKINLHTLRNMIAMVPQETNLFNESIKYNLMYGNLNVTMEDIENAVKRVSAYDFIQEFPDKYEQVVGSRGVKLSVGQKQRLAIARAILRNPKILILDEPTSALDSMTEKVITESLSELMASRTTFIVAHRLSTVRKADKIIVFKKGRVAETGTHEELMKIDGGVYCRMYSQHIGLQ